MESFDLLCDGVLVGSVSNAEWSDFPWFTGKSDHSEMPSEVRTLLDWLAWAADQDDTPEPPFPSRLLDNWTIRNAAGEVKPVSLPLVDWEDGTVELC